MRDFWHWLTTSRYTASLEAQNAELKAHVQRLEAIVYARFERPNRVAKESSPSTPVAKPERKMEQSVRIKRPGWTEVRAKETYWTDKEIQFEKTSAKNLAGLQ